MCCCSLFCAVVVDLVAICIVTSLCIWSFSTVRSCLPSFPLNSQESDVSSPLTESPSELSLQSLSSCDCINRSSSPFCFPSLTRSVDTQISRSRFVAEGFISTLGTHGLCPVPAIPSDLQHRIQLIIDVHAVYDAMQEIVRLTDIEQLHENVTHAEKHTPDDKEQFHLNF